MTLTIASSANWTKDIDKSLAEQFTQETGIKVEFQPTPDDQYSNVLKAKLSTGEGPDIFMVPSGVGMNEFLPAKNFLELDNEPWVARAEPWAIAGTSFNGHVVAMNLWSADGWGLLYDPAKFAKAGITSVPKTYEELLAACDKLVAAGFIPIHEFGSAVWHQPLWLNAVTSTAKKTDADYMAKFNANQLKLADIPEYELALQQQKELADKGCFGKDFMAETWEGTQQAMASGKYAMILAYSTYQNEVQAAYPDTGADKWEMFPSPAGRQHPVRDVCRRHRACHQQELQEHRRRQEVSRLPRKGRQRQGVLCGPSRSRRNLFEGRCGQDHARL